MFNGNIHSKIQNINFFYFFNFFNFYYYIYWAILFNILKFKILNFNFFYLELNYALNWRAYLVALFIGPPVICEISLFHILDKSFLYSLFHYINNPFNVTFVILRSQGHTGTKMYFEIFVNLRP